MATRCIVSEYVDQAMTQAEYNKLEHGTFSARIPSCTGVLAFAETLHECEQDLRSTLEEWTLLGLKLGHALPVIGGIDFSNEWDRL